jgi:TPR repeat protein
MRPAQRTVIAVLLAGLSLAMPVSGQAGQPRTDEAAEQLKLADKYLFGTEGAAKDVARGMAYLRESVDRGFPAAELQLAAQYRLGEGVPKDPEQALFWERKAAEGGNIVAQMVMGERYAAGFGVTKDLGQAISWYRRAAEPMSFYRYRAVTRLVGLEKARAQAEP